MRMMFSLNDKNLKLLSDLLESDERASSELGNKMRVRQIQNVKNALKSGLSSVA